MELTLVVIDGGKKEVAGENHHLLPLLFMRTDS